MAISKKIEKNNGIIVNYHRITSLNKITNQCNIIEVNSYINENQRLKEKEYQNLQIKNNESLTEEEEKELSEGINVLIEANFITIPYNENMTIEDAYEYLKSIEKYKDAEDI